AAFSVRRGTSPISKQRFSPGSTESRGSTRRERATRRRRPVLAGISLLITPLDALELGQSFGETALRLFALSLRLFALSLRLFTPRGLLFDHAFEPCNELVGIG